MLGPNCTKALNNRKSRAQKYTINMRASFCRFWNTLGRARSLRRRQQSNRPLPSVVVMQSMIFSSSSSRSSSSCIHRPRVRIFLEIKAARSLNWHTKYWQTKKNLCQRCESFDADSKFFRRPQPLSTLPHFRNLLFLLIY